MIAVVIFLCFCLLIYIKYKEAKETEAQYKANAEHDEKLLKEIQHNKAVDDTLAEYLLEHSTAFHEFCLEKDLVTPLSSDEQRELFIDQFLIEQKQTFVYWAYGKSRIRGWFQGYEQAEKRRIL